MGSVSSGNKKPHNAKLTAAKRRKAIAMLKAGFSVLDVARAFQMTRQGMWKVGKKANIL